LYLRHYEYKNAHKTAEKGIYDYSCKDVHTILALCNAIYQ